MGSGDLSPKQARLIALAAQGLHLGRPTDDVGDQHLARLLDHVGLIQIDSVSAAARSHELLLFSRFGAHARGLVEAAAVNGTLFEYWGHEASYIPVEQQRYFRWKMAKAAEGGVGNELIELQRTSPWFVDDVFRFVEDNGPVVAGDIGNGAEATTPWDWDDSKRALEFLFWCGRISARRRASDFARVYDLPERLIPLEHLDSPTPTEAEARKELLMIAARSQGVGTAADLADYHRQLVTAVQPLLNELVLEQRLLSVRLPGWPPAYLHPDAELPESIDGAHLLSPFDSLLWSTERVERVFGFTHNVETYLPESRREYGYYVMPFMLDGELVGRVDVRADRHRGLLLVPGAWAELGAAIDVVAPALAEQLRDLAAWLELDQIEVDDRGDLSKPISRIFRGY
jgi:uncharacterized protein